MKRTILAISVYLGLVPSGAYAVDWSLSSTLSETVEANDNPFLHAIAAGTFDSLALKGDGTVVAWGCGISFGQCNVPPDLSGVRTLAAAWSHSLAVNSDGNLIVLPAESVMSPFCG